MDERLSSCPGGQRILVGAAREGNRLGKLLGKRASNQPPQEVADDETAGAPRWLADGNQAAERDSRCSGLREMRASEQRANISKTGRALSVIKENTQYAEGWPTGPKDPALQGTPAGTAVDPAARAGKVQAAAGRGR